MGTDGCAERYEKHWAVRGALSKAGACPPHDPPGGGVASQTSLPHDKAPLPDCHLVFQPDLGVKML